MAINPIEIATVARSQDYAIIKHNEDHKAIDQQAALLDQTLKDAQEKQSEVLRQERAKWHDKSFDAREKGSNEYYGDGGEKKHEKNKEKKQQEHHGTKDQVIVNGHQSFDIKI